MSQQLTEIEKVATGVLSSFLASASGGSSHFRLNTSLESVGELLLVGNAYRDFDDGSCIAVLNPDAELQKRLKPGVGYTSAILSNMVRGKCDAVVRLSRRGGETSVVRANRVRRQ
jgi:hypothetical protein